jgi:predicted Zn finger-like uncharacterized protein
MALVTTCPNCGTSFRVVADQLKLRRGMVRCGSCMTVFSGLDQLRRIEDPATAPLKPTGAGAPDAASGAVDEASGAADSATADSATATAHIDRDAEEDLEAELDAGAEDYAPHRAGTLDAIGDEVDSEAEPFEIADLERLEAAEFARLEASALEPLDVFDEPTDKVARGRPYAERDATEDASPFNIFRSTRPEHRQFDEDAIIGDEIPDDAFARRALAGGTIIGGPPALSDDHEIFDDGEQAIDYFSADERSRGFFGRNAWLKLLAAGLLALTLVLQLVLANRDWLAARFPALEPAVATLASPFGLTVSMPQSLDTLRIESFELQAAAQSGLFAVSAILRNDARHAVRWPSMLLTLTDASNRVLARKIIDPNDYLGATAGNTGLRPRSERPIRIALETAEIEPAGYSVVLFYR